MKSRQRPHTSSWRHCTTTAHGFAELVLVVEVDVAMVFVVRTSFVPGTLSNIFVVVEAVVVVATEAVDPSSMTAKITRR